MSGRLSAVLAHPGRAAAVLLAAVMVLVPYGLLAWAVPINRDSGVFMYAGRIIGDGRMPYLDAWDHKGPLLYLFNALGLSLGGPGGVVVLEGTLLFLALVVAVDCWRRVVPPACALAVAALFLLAVYATFEGGNLTESYCVPFTLVAYSLAYLRMVEPAGQGDGRPSARRVGAALGLALAVAFLTRPNNGAGLAVFGLMVLAFMPRGEKAPMVLAGAATFAIVVGAVLGWVLLRGAGPGFADQYFLYNVAYSGGVLDGARRLLWTVQLQTMLDTQLGMATLLLLALLPVEAALLLRRREGKRWSGRSAAAAVCLLGVFAADLLGQVVSGRPYLHYLLVTCPALAVLAVAVIRLMRGVLAPPLGAAGKVLACMLAAIAVLGLPAAADVLSKELQAGVRRPGTPQHELVAYLQGRTAPTDTVLVHGAETWLLAAADRRSPTSITYLYPIFGNFQDTATRYVADVLEHRPTYIVETPQTCGLRDRRCAAWEPMFAPLRAELARSYVFEKELHGYRFWRRG